MRRQNTHRNTAKNVYKSRIFLNCMNEKKGVIHFWLYPETRHKSYSEVLTEVLLEAVAEMATYRKVFWKQEPNDCSEI